MGYFPQSGRHQLAVGERTRLNKANIARRAAVVDGIFPGAQ
jgi:hypothetical protein